MKHLRLIEKLKKKLCSKALRKIPLGRLKCGSEELLNES
jgi:hypothetical protein